MSSSAQQAREALGIRLREIREDAGLNGSELARCCGWHKSKTSRIENARTPASDADIRAWCEACSAEPGTVADLIAASREVSTMWVEWKRMERTGLRRAQEMQQPIYEQTKVFRAYSSGLVPGILQTSAYTTAVLAAIRDRRGLADDVDAAVAARMERQRVLYEGDHQFALLIEESLLRVRIGTAAAMAGQLSHLMSVAFLPSVALGVIPFGVDRSEMRWPIEDFWIFDDDQVVIELVSGYLTVTRPGEVAMYAAAFTELAEVAVYGAAARALITAAGDALE